MFKKVTVFFAVVLCSLNLSGCFLLIPAAIGVAGGIGTAKWLSDKLVEDVSHPYHHTVDAARDGLKDMKLVIFKETTTDEMTQFSSNYADGRTVWVTVARVSETVSRIEVRVGVWGGQAEARQVLDGILAHL